MISRWKEAECFIPKYNSVKEYYEEEFRKIHKEGSERFGTLWIGMNQRVMESIAGKTPDWSPYTPENKYILSLIAYEMCELNNEIRIEEAQERERINDMEDE